MSLELCFQTHFWFTLARKSAIILARKESARRGQDETRNGNVTQEEEYTSDLDGEEACGAAAGRCAPAGEGGVGADGPGPGGGRRQSGGVPARWAGDERPGSGVRRAAWRL